MFSPHCFSGAGHLLFSRAVLSFPSLLLGCTLFFAGLSPPSFLFPLSTHTLRPSLHFRLVAVVLFLYSLLVSPAMLSLHTLSSPLSLFSLRFLFSLFAPLSLVSNHSVVYFLTFSWDTLLLHLSAISGHSSVPSLLSLHSLSLILA